MPTSLESNTIASLETCYRLYNEASNDVYRLQQVNNAISVLSALRGFLIAKLDVLYPNKDNTGTVPILLDGKKPEP